jgi:hypothetical protein
MTLDSDSNISRVKSAREFETAYSRSFIRQIFDLLQFRTNQLIPFDDVRGMIGFTGQKSMGRQMVPIKKIIGSEGRAHQFSRSFLPRSFALRGRWISMHQAFDSMKSLPPVELYEIGGYYFVRDGNHRISVAKIVKIPSIEAEVTSVSFRGSLEGATNLKAITRRIKKVQREDFFAKTGLFSELDKEWFSNTFNLGYEKLYRTILQSGLSAEQWFNDIFKPVCTLLEKEHLSYVFPGRTKADIYLLFKSFIDAAPNRELAEEVFISNMRDTLQKKHRPLLSRLRQLFYRNIRPE